MRMQLLHLVLNISSVRKSFFAIFIAFWTLSGCSQPNRRPYHPTTRQLSQTDGAATAQAVNVTLPAVVNHLTFFETLVDSRASMTSALYHVESVEYDGIQTHSTSRISAHAMLVTNSTGVASKVRIEYFRAWPAYLRCRKGARFILCFYSGSRELAFVYPEVTSENDVRDGP